MRAEQFFRVLRSSPVVTVDDLTGNEPFVVVAPHPDDETLGCAGLMCEAAGLAIPVGIIVATDGSASHPGSASYGPARLAALRRTESLAAAGVCGVPEAAVHFLGLIDTEVPLGGPVFDAAVASVCVIIDRLQARSVFVTWRGDPHCDHEAVHDVAHAAAARSGARLWTYPVWGWTLAADTLVPDAGGCRLNVIRWRKHKAQAIACHRSQTTKLIDDDPDGFILDTDALERFHGRYEYFIEADA